MDPLDGSSNIDVNVSVGTIFLYLPPRDACRHAGDRRRLPAAGQQAGGRGLCGLRIVDDAGVYHRLRRSRLHLRPVPWRLLSMPERMRFPEKGNTYSINEGNYIKFPQGVKKYIKYCQEEDKATQRPYTSRYIGSLVADFHRNLLKGGIYLYPSTASHPEGKLRLLYECNPMAFLAEQAGGKASDGKERILDIIPESLHQRRSFFVGNNHMVEDVENFIKAFPDA